MSNINKYISFGKNILLSNIARLDNPYKLTFALTYKCNSRCKICQIWKKKKQKELSLIDIKKIFTINNYFNWIDLTGGEVFLRQDLLEIVKNILRTQKKLYFLHIPTNGILTDKIAATVDKILSLKPNKLVISIALDGPETIHDQLRGIRGNWRQAVLTFTKLQKLKSRNFDCVFGMTLSKYNYRYIEQSYLELKKTIPKLNLKDIHFNIAHHSSHYYDNKQKKLGVNKKIGQELKDFNRKKKFDFSSMIILEKIYQTMIPRYLDNRKTPVDCQALSASIFINPYGDLYPCTMWNKKIINLKQIDFNLKNIWNNNSIDETLKLIKDKLCPNCWTPCEAYQSILGSLFKFFII